MLFPAKLGKYVTTNVPGHGSFHEVPLEQAFYGIELPCSGTFIKRRYIVARVSFTDWKVKRFVCVRVMDDNLSIIPFFFHVTVNDS